MRNNPRNRNRKNRKLQDIDHKQEIKTLGIIILVLILILLVVATFYTIKNKSDYANFAESARKEIQTSAEAEGNASNSEESEEVEETDTTFTLSAIGDVMCHNTQYKDAYDSSTDTYDFSYVFDDINYYTKTADICVASLETTFAGEERGYSNYPTFNSPDALAYNLKNIGVDVISTAGNHALDTGYTGLCRTLDVLDSADISHVGTYRTQEEQDKILYKYVKGIKIAFINYTYGTNGIAVPSDKPYCVNLIDKDSILKHIQSAKDGGAEIIVSCMHWGTEYQTSPNSEQTELADFLFQNGVDIIIGNHPHVLQSMEKRTVTLEDGTTKDGFVIYALGNFIADQNAENTRNSIILNLTITKHTNGSVTIDKAEYTPIYMYKDTTKTSKKMKLLDIEKTIFNYENYIDSSISDNLYSLLKKQLDKIKSIVGDEIVPAS